MSSADGGGIATAAAAAVTAEIRSVEGRGRDARPDLCRVRPWVPRPVPRAVRRPRPRVPQRRL